MIKRAFDFVASALGLIALSPLLAVLAILVKLTSRGPILYRGVRAGRNGVPLRILKFRTMVADAEKVGGPTTSDDDERVTKIGLLMRRFKLDELPQLFNVLSGTMSLVGPRPEVLSEAAEYTPEQRRALEMRPGITDWASIWNSDEGAVLAGVADPHAAYKERIQPTKLKLQVKYRDEHSFLMDMKIIIYTLRKIVDKGWVPPEIRPYGKP
jgi:lipopolysaccharide/colanic/teichoic acid biosynthesis glycosyltransferase